MKKKNIFIIIILLIATCLIIVNRINNNSNNSNKKPILGIKGIIKSVEENKDNIVLNIYNTVPNKKALTNNAIVNVEKSTIIKEKDLDKKYSIDDIDENMLVEVYIKDTPDETYPTTIKAYEIRIITNKHPNYLKYIGDMCYNILSTNQKENITNKTPNIYERKALEGVKAYNVSELGTVYTDISNQDVYIVEFIQDKLMMMPNNILIYVSKDNLKILGFGLVD